MNAVNPFTYFFDPERDPSKFNSSQQKQARILENAIREQGLPPGFAEEDVHVRQDKTTKIMYISNQQQQMAMLNEGRLEIFYRCPKCGNEGFKNTLSHAPRCDEIPW